MPNTGTSASTRSLRVRRIAYVEHRRIARTVAQEHAVGIAPAGPTPARVAGNTRTSQPYAREPAQDVPLHPVVVGRDLQRTRRRAALGRRRELVRRASAGCQSNGASQVTPSTRSEPSIGGSSRARSTSSRGSTSPVAMTPRITPADRSTRVSARVSMSEMATMLLRDQVVAERASARQLLAIGDSSRMMKPATCGARDSPSSSATP